MRKWGLGGLHNLSTNFTDVLLFSDFFSQYKHELLIVITMVILTTLTTIC